MNIYFAFSEYDLIITVKKETYLKFKPTYLYIKTHNKTGLKYFGKTIKDPLEYKGSGTRWNKHLKKHGYDVSTKIYGFYKTYEECLLDAVGFSFQNEIVNNKLWANITPEFLQGASLPGELNGMFGKKHSAITLNEISIASTNMWEDQDKRDIHSKLMTGENNPMFGKSDHAYGIVANAKANKGKTLEEIYGIENGKQLRLKFSIAQKGSTHILKERICPHCCLKGKGGDMSRYHFDNCLLNPDNKTNRIGIYSNYPRIFKYEVKFKCTHCCAESCKANHFRWHNDNCQLNPINPKNIIGSHSDLVCKCDYRLVSGSGNARRFFKLNHGENCKIFTSILNQDISQHTSL